MLIFKPDKGNWFYVQADVLQAAKDISSILADEKAAKSKKVLHPNEMAALALTLNPVS
jgi:hypothetical protein